jgi:hypothetical protein
MAIGRVARKLYAQQGEFGTVRKAYKEAFRRQMIANYAPANVIGRMFGFGSMFHTMAKRAFGTPEWNPRSLETGRPDIVPGQSQTRGRQGAARSTAMMRASDMVLADIAENTERTADAMENINKIAAVEQKKEDLGENFKREQDFEENLKKITPLSVEKMGPSSSVLEKNKQPSMLGDIIGSLIKEAAPYVLGGIGIALLTAKLTEWLTDGEWWKKNLVDPLATVIKQGIDGAIGAATSAVEGTVNSFWETDIGRFLLRPFQPTGSNPAREGKQNERFHAQAKRRGRKTVSKSML